MNRRDFLKTAGLSAAAFGLSESLLGRVARAAEQHDRYVIVGYFEGGWDALLGLDPGDEFEIKLGRKQIRLIPAGATDEEE